MNYLGRSAFGTAVLLIAVFASLAGAAEITRDEYVERVEPICKANTEANEKILSGVRADVKQNKLKLAAGKLERRRRRSNRPTANWPRCPSRPKTKRSSPSGSAT